MPGERTALEHLERNTLSEICSFGIPGLEHWALGVMKAAPSKGKPYKESLPDSHLGQAMEDFLKCQKPPR